MPLAELSDWLGENTRPDLIWYAKRLSANDTLATEAHQAGPYIPKDFLFRVFPGLNRPDAENPDVRFDLYIDSHADHWQVRAVWYNNRLRGGTRNEARLTNFGGRSSALLDPDSTGSVALFVFSVAEGRDARECHVWVCDRATEEDLIEDRIGPVEPGRWRIWSPDPRLEAQLAMTVPPVRPDCWLQPEEIPVAWTDGFPAGAEIVAKTVEFRPAHGVRPDIRLLRRRDCEYEIFQSLELALELPAIQRGFETVEAFISYAQTVLQRRRSRAGRSLELHARHIFTEEGLVEGEHFSWQPESEPGKRPDFLFPSAASYGDGAFPADRLRMLAAKTTCKDRWRQVLNEAERIPVKHLLTLQEGISEGQFREMREARVRLVVPFGLHDAYPDAVRPHLLTFESFIGDVRLLALATN